MGDLEQDSQEWADKQDAIIDDGAELVKKAHEEALDYVTDVVNNLGDRQWRKMSVETQAVEMGAGKAIADHLIPVIYNDMKKGLHKRLKLPKEQADAVREIYIGRVVKNLVKELNNYERN